MILELLLLLTFYILQPFTDKEPLVQKASIKQQNLNIVFLITTFHNDVIIEYENSISLNLGEKPATFKARLKPAKHRGVVKPQVGRSIESSEKRANLRRIKRRFHLFGPRWPSCPDISSLIQLSQAPFPLMPLSSTLLDARCQPIKAHQGKTSSVPGPQLRRLH